MPIYDNPKKMDTSSLTCEQLFQLVANRQVEALMFHDQMADLFDFLGLPGFKRMHEYQTLKESVEHRSLKRYYINHHNKLLMETDVHSKDIIPDEWYKYGRWDVTAQVRKQAIEKAFDDYCDWEKETKRCYEEYAVALFHLGKVADYEKVKSLVCDVDMELKCIERLGLKLKSVNFNDVYIASIQDEVHEHYREKTKSIGVDIC